MARWWVGTHHRVDMWGGHHRCDHVLLDVLQRELAAATAAGEPGATAFSYDKLCTALKAWEDEDYGQIMVHEGSRGMTVYFLQADRYVAGLSGQDGLLLLSVVSRTAAPTCGGMHAPHQTHDIGAWPSTWLPAGDDAGVLSSFHLMLMSGSGLWGMLSLLHG